MKKAEYKDLLIIYFKISVGVVQMICVCRDGDARLKIVWTVSPKPHIFQMRNYHR